MGIITNAVNNSTNWPVEPVHSNSEFSEHVNTLEHVNNASNGFTQCIQCGSNEYRIEDERFRVCAACSYAVVK